VVPHVDVRRFVTLFPGGGVAFDARARAEWMLGRASVSIERRDQKVFLSGVAGALLNMRGNA
jgi:putative hemolysin